MRIRHLVAAAGAAVLVAAPVSAASADTLADQINSLEVSAERTSGYDRDAFGDYDRDALLAQNYSAWPGCDGYYSRYDGQCYPVGGGTSKEEADDEVDVDHRVALLEAWESGISGSDLDAFGGDTANLSLLTDNVNSSKGGQGIAEWTPQAGVCHYVTAYVATKASYNLSVDEAELAALLDLAGQCGGGDSEQDTDEPTGGNDAGDGGTGGDSEQDTADGGTDQVAVVPEGGVQTGGGGMAHVVSQR